MVEECAASGEDPTEIRGCSLYGRTASEVAHRGRRGAVVYCMILICCIFPIIGNAEEDLLRYCMYVPYIGHSAICESAMRICESFFLAPAIRIFADRAD